MDSQKQDAISDSQLVGALNSYENMNVDDAAVHDDSLTDSQLIQAVQYFQSKLSIIFICIMFNTAYTTKSFHNLSVVVLITNTSVNQ